MSEDLAANETVQTVESAPTEPVVEEAVKTEETAQPELKTEEKPGKHSFQRKIDRLYKSAAEHKARADYLEQQLQQLQPQKKDEGGPRIEDFDDIDKFVDAKADYQAKQHLASLSRKAQEDQAREQAQNFVREWEQKRTQAYDKYDDFDEIVGELKPDNALSVAIMDSDIADDLAYFLGKNVDEVRRIAQLPPLRMAKEIAKLEMKLASAKQEVKTPSQAPEPINPLSGKTGMGITSSLQTDDYKTFLKLRNKELGRK